MEKTAIVTGAYGEIGKAIGLKLGELSYKVVLAGRDENRLKICTNDIIRKTGNKNISYEVVDLSCHRSIKNFSERWSSPLHILINNAGTTPRNREETSEEIELQFATNVLGYFWMIEEFLKFLKDSAPSRIINVASNYAGELNLSDPEFKHRRYDNNSAYRQSKQANRMLTIAHAAKLKSYNISVNSCHPGEVNSKLSNGLGFGGYESAEQGAKTPFWLAVSPEVEGVTGKYFDDMCEVKDRFASDSEGIEKLYKLCSDYK